MHLAMNACSNCITLAIHTRLELNPWLAVLDAAFLHAADLTSCPFCFLLEYLGSICPGLPQLKNTTSLPFVAWAIDVVLRGGWRALCLSFPNLALRLVCVGRWVWLLFPLFWQWSIGKEAAYARSARILLFSYPSSSSISNRFCSISL